MKMAVKTMEKSLNVKCKYLNECPDVKRLLKIRENEKSEITYLNLADQYHELCLTASPESCSIYQSFEAQYKKQYKDIDIGF